MLEFNRDAQVEGLADFNDRHRTYVEAGYNTTQLSLDYERIELIEQVCAAQETYQQLEKAVEEEDGLFVEVKREELGRAKRTLDWLTDRLDSIEYSLKGLVDVEPEECDEEADEFVGQFHWRCAHDFWSNKLTALEVKLERGQTEAWCLKALKYIDKAKERGWCSSTWYYVLSTMIIKSRANVFEAYIFSQFTKEHKKQARKVKDWYWEAAFDRLENFKRACEVRAKKYDREWKLPTSEYSLDVMLVTYEDRWDGRMGLQEDAMIEAIDEVAWYAKKGMNNE